jgi:hypothetical protein
MDNRNPVSRPHYSKDYDDTLTELVAGVYADDIEQLQYRFDDQAGT